MHKYLFLFLLLSFSDLSAQIAIPNQLMIQAERPIDQMIRSNSSFVDLKSYKLLSSNFNIYLAEFDSKVDLDQKEKELAGLSSVQYVQRNHQIEWRYEPDDANFANQWNMLKISADKVWDLVTGGETINGDEIVIAVIDNGFNVNHEDLSTNVWTNQAEIADNNIDDDNNGYIDDFNGWNYLNQSDTHANSEHGSSVAGVVGAQGDNGQGVTGVNIDVQLMLLSGANVESQIVQAYDYVIDMRDKYNKSNGAEGAFVVATNFSAGIGRRFGTDFPIWCGMYDKLGQVGIISATAVDNNIYDVDIEGDMPTTCQSEFMISVTNTTEADVLDAAFGKINVDLSAPGDQIFTTSNFNEYHTISGSSLSTPHVAGAVGLLYAAACSNLLDNAFDDPKDVAQTIKNAIINGTVPLQSLENITLAEGRLDLFESVAYLQTNCGGSLGDLDIKLKVASTNDGFTVLSYETPNFDPYTLHIYDATGRLMSAETIVPPIFDAKEIRILTNGWASGIYFYNFFDDNNSRTGSFYKP